MSTDKRTDPRINRRNADQSRKSWLRSIHSLGLRQKRECHLAKALPKALEDGTSRSHEELGFKTVNLDNYCGYAEMGEGEEIVGIAGHLDIVPVGGDWTYDPFSADHAEGDHVYGTRNHR